MPPVEAIQAASDNQGYKPRANLTIANPRQ
jgi:hypothetical protein